MPTTTETNTVEWPRPEPISWFGPHLSVKCGRHTGVSAPAVPRAVTPVDRLEAIAAVLDRASYRGDRIPPARLHELAEAVRKVQAEIS